MKLFVTYLLILSFSISCATTYSQVNEKRYTHIKDIYKTAERIRGNYIPYDLEDALRTLDTLCTEEDKAKIRKMEVGDFAALSHFGLALYLRNNWLMRLDSRITTYMREHYRFISIYDIDDISNAIVEVFDRKLHDENFDVEAYMQEHYPKK